MGHLSCITCSPSPPPPPNQCWKQKRPQYVIAMYAGKGLYTSRAGKHSGRYKSYFLSLKPVLAFQTLTLATVFFLSENCSCTLLPGFIGLQTPITRLQYIGCLRSFRTHFDSLKCVDDLLVYQGFMMHLNHQAGIQGTLKQCLRY